MLHVTGNPHAEEFYLACGFKQIGATRRRVVSNISLKTSNLEGEGTCEQLHARRSKLRLYRCFHYRPIQPPSTNEICP